MTTALAPQELDGILKEQRHKELMELRELDVKSNKAQQNSGYREFPAR